MFINWGQLAVAGPLIFLAGFVDSVAGGGGLISLPAYVMAGLPPHMALGSNKMSSSIGTVVATSQYIKGGYIQKSIVPVSVVCALVGSWLGARCVLLVDDKVLRIIMLVFIPVIAVFTLLRKDFLTPSGSRPSNSRAQVLTGTSAFVIGWYDGFFGPGTGMFLMLAFVCLIKLDVVTACGNTKVVNLSSNIAAVVVFIANGEVLYSLALPCAVFAMLGGYAGARLTMKNGAKIVKPVMLLVIALLLVKLGRDFIVTAAAAL